VQNTEEAGEIAADVFSIEGEFFDCIRGGLEQSGVSDALVLSHERAQRFWDGEGDEEVMARKLALDVSLESVLSFTVLTGGTVAIAAGNKELLWLSAAFTLVERDAASRGSTGHDGIDDFAMSFGHRGSVTLEVFGSEGSKDFTDGGHDRVPPSHG